MNIMPLMRYGATHRAQRKVSQRALGSKASISRLEPLVEYETQRFLSRLVDDPEDLTGHIRR